MFALSSDDLHARLLGWADGPAHSKPEATAAGLSVVSCDRLSRWSTAQIRGRMGEPSETVIEQTERNRHEFVWTSIRSIEKLRELRMSSMERFLVDYENGRQENRYVDAELPSLPFRDGAFDLALCSHFLFLYSEQLSEDVHV